VSAWICIAHKPPAPFKSSPEDVSNISEITVEVDVHSPPDDGELSLTSVQSLSDKLDTIRKRRNMR